MTKIEELGDRIIAGDRRALSQAITLAESSREDHRAEAIRLVSYLKLSGRKANRIGLSGTPGVGKSTFIESFGKYLTGKGLRVAVLAIDPSSQRSGGSILGDKTRMDRLSRDPKAFIRPSPSQSHLGGVARHTREVVSICEAAGFDIVIVETVGVGQSETIVAHICDLFILLLAPAAGDELQGVKRGIMEMADIILVNKADGNLKLAATRTCADFSGALSLLRNRPHDPVGYPKVLSVSAIEEIGFDDTWSSVTELLKWRCEKGYFDKTRASQARFWFEEDVRQGILASLSKDEIFSMMEHLATEVENGKISPEIAASMVLRRMSDKS